MLRGLFSSCGKQGLLFLAMHGLLTAVASLVAEHGFYSTLASVVVACGLMSCGSPPLEHRLNSCGHGLSCSLASGISLDQKSNPCLLHWQADSLPLSHQGSPLTDIFEQSSQNQLTKSV